MVTVRMTDHGNDLPPDAAKIIDAVGQRVAAEASAYMGGVVEQLLRALSTEAARREALEMRVARLEQAHTEPTGRPLVTL
jgi:hypothetical protein